MAAPFANIAGVVEAKMRPGFACVSGLVDAVAMGDVAANGRLAHADVDHVGVGWRDGDAADGGASEVAVGDVLPEEPSIRGLPDAATGGAAVEGGIRARVDSAATTP